MPSRGNQPIRLARVVPALCACLLALAGSAAAATGPVEHGVRTITQDQRGATFQITPGAARFDTANVDGVVYSRVTVGGALMVEAPGRPSLPTMTLHVAIPEGTSPRLRITSEDWSDQAGPAPLPVPQQRFISDDPATGPVSEFRTTPEGSIYRGVQLYPPQAAVIGAGAMVGEWWVAPVYVHPIRWDPKAAAYRVLRSMSLRVDFVPATDQELTLRPASRPGAQARAWDRVQRGLVKNYESARSFPARPRVGALKPLSRSASTLRSRLTANPEWKLSVANTGWVSVSYATLASTGFPSNIDIANVSIEERGYDDIGDSATVTAIPVVARDVGTIGKFDAGDAITFYARSMRDRFGAGNIELRYSDVNVYWLTWGNTPAPTPGTVSGDIPGAATVPTSFRDVTRMEQDKIARVTPKQTEPEYLFWTDGLPSDQFATQLPFLDPDPSQPFRVRARYQGLSTREHRLDIYFDGASGKTDTLTYDAEFSDVLFNVHETYLLDTGFTIPGSHIGGLNRYRHVGQSRTNSGFPWDDGSYACLDVIEVTYNRFFTARSNALSFTSGGSGSVFEPHVGGFTSSAIEVYDVTDPLAPMRVLPLVAVNPAGGGTFEAVFRTDATSGERRFVAFTSGSETALSTGDVIAEIASNLRAAGAYGASSVARAIFIAPAPFITEANRLATYRRSQGYVVEVADVQDVYDEFNGGIKSARAIRRYVRHGYLDWSPRPTYVVLLGDGSLDYRHHLPETSIDWVPTFLRFDAIAGTAGNELVAEDPYYSLDLTQVEPAGGAFIPSVSIARIPASSAQELGQFVDKVIRYEAFQPSDNWRGRLLLVSDDAFSSGVNSTLNYCYQGQEEEFKGASLESEAIIAQSPAGSDLAVDAYDLKTYTDAVTPDVFGCKSIAAVAANLAQTNGGYDALISQINPGELILNIESHGNRYLVAHETILYNGSPIFQGVSQKNGPDRIQNVERPSFLMIWACHTNQFADGPLVARLNFGNGDVSVDSLDALGEQWLLMPDRGSIASLGSTAFEFLTSNHNFNNLTTRAFYDTPPAPDPAPGEPAQARWILGEVMLQAEVANGMLNNPINPEMNHTVHLFADPMLRMDALPPRVYQVTVAGSPFVDNAALTNDSPTDSSALVASLRDEVGIDSVYVTEQDLTGGAIVTLDPQSYSVAFSDSSRLATLTTNVRPRVGNYDLQIRAVDVNGRLRLFTLQVRTPIRYLADGVDIVNGVFVQSSAQLRAEVTSPIPLTSDSLELVLDGGVVASTKAKLDTAGRRWALNAIQAALTTGTHVIQVAVGGRTTGLDQRTFQTTSEFTIRGLAVVDPRVQGAGCGGSVFQYELSAAAQKVELLILTVSGRRVASIDLPRQAGFNVYCWDGRDGQAHDTAQGVYFYRLRATDTSGKAVSKDGRMIRAR